MAFQKLARAEEVPPGRTKYFRPGGRPVILAHYQGRIYALGGVCPNTKKHPEEECGHYDVQSDAIHGCGFRFKLTSR